VNPEFFCSSFDLLFCNHGFVLTRIVVTASWLEDMVMYWSLNRPAAR